jgi:membrane associated rhomboid family serine protease
MRPSWGGQRRYEGGSWLPFNWYSIPVTRALLFTTVGVFLLFFLTGQHRSIVWALVPFRSESWYLQPWTWFTYPFMETPSLWILLTLYILYAMGGMLERSWGSANYAVLFFAFTVIGALAFLIPLYLLGKPVVLTGLYIPLTALITAWAALDPELEVSFWGLPVKAKFLAAMWVALNYFYFGMQYGDPILALFVLAAPAAAFFYVRKLPRLNLGTPTLRRDTGYLREEPRDRDYGRREPRERIEREQTRSRNPFRRRQEQAEIERLKKLLGEDDDHPRVER